MKGKQKKYDIRWSVAIVSETEPKAKVELSIASDRGEWVRRNDRKGMIEIETSRNKRKKEISLKLIDESYVEFIDESYVEFINESYVARKGKYLKKSYWIINKKNTVPAREYKL